MPSLGLGSAGGCHPDPDGTERSCPGYIAATQALGLGYRSFHDALSYGNQAGLGAAIKDSNISRKDIFVMSMVPKYLMGYNETKASVAASLEQLQVDYLDLVMVHHRAADAAEWPRRVNAMRAFPDNWAAPGSPVNNGSKATWQAPACARADWTWVGCQDQTWQALTELKREGKIRAIGVSNWLLSNLQRMLALQQELPAVNQVEAHIGWWDADLLSWCAEHGVLVQAATPLARSLPALVKPGGNEVVTAIANKYHKTPAQVSLRFLIEVGVSPIPSAHSAKYQKENLDIFDFNLTQAEVRSLGAVAVSCRGNPADGLHKCWADPGDMMCVDPASGRMAHCP